MKKNITEMRAAILTENGFEESELTSPMQALRQNGVKVDIVSPQKEKVKGWSHGNWSIELPVDKRIGEANPEDYDMLLIPGGVINPDKLRRDPACISFAQHFLEQGKPLAAICHGPQLLIETGMLSGRTLTSFQSIKTDLVNAGVNWVDKAVVVDNGLITSRSPADLDAFNRKIIEELQEGKHATTGQFTQHDR
ncbi:MAG TPA: type 1 glutamine amidotransferase domain-containing protein [Flavisolibacter sp.]